MADISERVAPSLRRLGRLSRAALPPANLLDRLGVDRPRRRQILLAGEAQYEAFRRGWWRCVIMRQRVPDRTGRAPGRHPCNHPPARPAEPHERTP